MIFLFKKKLNIILNTSIDTTIAINNTNLLYLFIHHKLFNSDIVKYFI
jgi:hypothetical protein